MCEALASIHEQGIVHRDLKPANIILTDDLEPKIADFGIARVENSQLTHHNEILGSVLYIAPEIWIGEEPTLSIDLYGLGIILYEMVTGKTPFEGSSPGELMRKHLQSQPTAPKDINPQLPSYINRLIIRLLSKQSSERPKDANEIIHILQRHISVSSNTQPFRAYRADTQEFLKAVDKNSVANLSKIDRTKIEQKTPTIVNPESISISRSFNLDKVGTAAEFTLGESGESLETEKPLENDPEAISLKTLAKYLTLGIILLSTIATVLYFL